MVCVDVDMSEDKGKFQRVYEAYSHAPGYLVQNTRVL